MLAKLLGSTFFYQRPTTTGLLFLGLLLVLIITTMMKTSLTQQPLTTIIVGSGLSGLACAKQIALGVPSPSSVLLLDKGRSVGGRLSTVTPRGSSGVWDKGAQFFTIRSDEFAAECESWSKKVWCQGFAGSKDGHNRYIGSRGMRGIAEDLAAKLPFEIRQQKKVTKISRESSDSLFSVELDSGEVLLAANVVLTSPVIQSLDLISSISHPKLESLQKIRYDKTITALLELSGPSSWLLTPPGGWQRPFPGVHFIGDSKAKGIDSNQHSVTIHFDPTFSDEHFDKSKEELEELVFKSVEQVIPRHLIVSVGLHKWRYAIPTILFPERHLECDFDGGSLFFCGDAFKQAAVEGAFLSGKSVGAKLQIKSKI